MSFADKLFAASEDERLPPAELRAWMRRAASRLRDHEAANTLERLCTINDIRAKQGLPLLGLDAILDDWSLSQGDKPFDDFDDEHKETKGGA
jgi:hypothetical protein